MGNLKCAAHATVRILRRSLRPRTKRRPHLFVVGGKKSGAGDLGLLTIKDGVLLGPNVSKFYITSDLPVAGMALSYAASCNSTYEISIYVKSGKKICGTLSPITAKLKKLLADLVKTKSYKERSDIYHEGGTPNTETPANSFRACGCLLF